MTQIIGVLTEDAVLLAADRRVTFIDTGEVKDDDRCKLVAICHHSALAYTGLAELDGLPTHEWVCHRLADARVNRPHEVATVLPRACETAFRAVGRTPAYPHSFVVGGFGPIAAEEGWRPYFGEITNTRDDEGHRLAVPRESFVARIWPLSRGTLHRDFCWGSPIAAERETLLHRNVQRIVERKAAMSAIVRLLVDEIVHTHSTKQIESGGTRIVSPVGRRILTMCIPRQVVEKGERTGESLLIGNTSPQPDVAIYGYFDRETNSVRDYSPAFVCGGGAMSPVEFVPCNAPGDGTVSARILRLPQKPGQ